MSRCSICNNILSDEDQRLIYRLECDLAKKGKIIDKYDEICVGCRLSNPVNFPERVDVSEIVGYTVIAEDYNEEH